ncbi:uncharacterized protein GGS25DRAFT_470498 [Hypoxylon fragiforme]|uniref:uncharacterized protein n=1 Tax=Hypoxylon fragiforme TaxID=63214 RepID=UPI0020C636CE|nr:uncharacterized protein GGS25DRAFT_470498 [Hypoxylon fragiforme]KAI2614144.1 hypothetical protein GGS25DRAFT_470498 [Hypoxylon fragiforme]
MNIPQNYAMGGGMPMSSYPMHAGMNPQQQQMIQRMQPPQPNTQGMSTPTPQRSFQGQPPQNGPAPNSTPTPQPHPLSTPQNTHATPRGQTPNSAQPQPQQQQPQHQPPTNNIQTPQTPTFPTSVQSNGPNISSSSTPLSPSVDSRDKERVGVILEINNELLLEAMQIQHTQQVLKKERASSNGTEGAANEPDKKSTEEEDILAQDYLHCMRRLQTNLTYLAALADKKGNVPVPPSPTYMKAPPLNYNIKLRMVVSPDGSESQEAPDRGETVKYILDLYKKLHALYPGIDPNKEPLIPATHARQGGQPMNAAKPGAQALGYLSPVPGKQKTPKMLTAAPPSSATNITTGP